ncbi:hypothetical protein NC651_009485 [Populus alba x Populus x berolinensis]|nr:hypothetical protein NC651_009485 [Populus alba x Populus x berolinensis]
MVEFRFFNHDHPFLFDEEKSCCVACLACHGPVVGIAYACTSCDSLLHKFCVEFPEEIHKNPLTILSKQHDSICFACKLDNFAFSYHCGACKFEVHLRCGSISGLYKHEDPDAKKYKHEGHEHFLAIEYRASVILAAIQSHKAMTLMEISSSYT